MRVLGLGNALVDILARLNDDDLLNQLKLPKGSMQLIDGKGAATVSEALKSYEKAQVSGGSAANTIHGLAHLGVQTGFIGKVGNDELGTIFKKDMELANIRAHLFYSNSPSGYCTSLISRDAERTMTTYLGAAIELTASDITESLFDNYHYFHVEGYMVQNTQLVENAFKMAKQRGLKTSLDLASYNVVEDNLEFLTRLVENYVDILFANEEEAKAFSGKSEKEALDYMGSKSEIAVLKLGARGSIIKHFNEIVEVGVIQAQSIDSTGAGDLYAAGFLFGLINQLSAKACGQIGALLAGNVIEVVGPKIDQERWSKIKHNISRITN